MSRILKYVHGLVYVVVASLAFSANAGPPVKDRKDMLIGSATGTFTNLVPDFGAGNVFNFSASSNIKANASTISGSATFAFSPQPGVTITSVGTPLCLNVYQVDSTLVADAVVRVTSSSVPALVGNYFGFELSASDGGSNADNISVVPFGSQPVACANVPVQLAFIFSWSYFSNVNQVNDDPGIELHNGL